MNGFWLKATIVRVAGKKIHIFKIPEWRISKNEYVDK